MKGTLTVTHPTWFKKNSTAQASEVPSTHKFEVQAGQVFRVLASREAANNHITITFDRGMGRENWNTWTVFRGHVAIALDMPETTSVQHISDIGLALIKKYEGFRGAAYICPAGVWTIGYGSTHGVKKGDRISEPAAVERLRREVQIYEAGVLKSLSIAPTQPQFDAMVSLAYNIGVGAFERSSVRRFHNQNAPQKAADAFLLWNKGGGRVLEGLVKRRKEERELYLRSPADSPQTDAIATPDVAPKPAPGRPPSLIKVPGIGTVDLYQQIVPGVPLYWYEATHGGTRIPQNATHAANIVALARQVGKARQQIGKPFRVTSWYRPEPWNSRAGGARQSQHLEGKGIDIAVEGETGRSLAQKLAWWPGGMGIYRHLPGIIHLDNRPNKARWGGA